MTGEKKQENSYVNSGLAMIMTILIVGVLVMTIINIVSAGNTVSMYVSDIAICGACIMSMLYCMYGYKKDAAKFFKWFCISFAISLIVVSVPSFIYRPVLNGVLALIGAVIMCVFAFAKDLGKKKSFILCIILMLTLVIKTVWDFIIGMYYMPAVARLIIGLSFAVMLYAKYADKATRGSK